MVLRCPYIMPNAPGVYLFLDKYGNPLYVGRATSLRRRVLSYFQGLRDSRLAEMLDLAAKIKHYKTDNLLEAVILEANLIKKNWPKYNVREKDNRSFIYIVIPKIDFPRPLIVRQRELQKFSSRAKIFGPYQSLSLVKNALRIIRRIFPYSVCKVGSGKPCFDRQIGLCPGACIDKISKKDYQKNIDGIILLLEGKKKRLLKKLKKENPAAAASLKHIQDVSLIDKSEFGILNSGFGISAKRIEGYDVSHLTGKETTGGVAVFTNGLADKNQYRLFKIKRAPANDDLRALEEMITRRFLHREWQFPDLILIDGGKPQVYFISKALRKLNVAIPVIGISKYIGAKHKNCGSRFNKSEHGDKLIFPPKTKKSLKDLAEASKNLLLKVREEAHRFAIGASRRRRKLQK